ncbi:MAG: glycosyltransferase family protein [Pseudomonadota bacterium]
MSKVVCIVQARMGSSRLPGKVLMDIGGKPSIDLLYDRLSKASKLDEIVFATSDLEKDDVLANHLKSRGYSLFRGSEQDVLARYAAAAREFDASIIVRVTGDCPLIDANLIDELVEGFLANDVDHYSNVRPPTYPHGMDAEVFSRKALETADVEAGDDMREHVTTYIHTHDKFAKLNHAIKTDHSKLRLTLDEPEDLDAIRLVYEKFAPEIHMTWQDIVSLVDEQEIVLPNSHLGRAAESKG